MKRSILPAIMNNQFAAYHLFFKSSFSRRIVDFFLITLSASAFAQDPCDSINHTYVSTRPTCFGSANGTINLTMTGGAAPYTFSWSNGAVTEDLNGLQAAAYTVNISDQNGCRDSATIVLSQPPALTNVIQQQNVLCHGASTGFIVTHAGGGTDPYNYFWSNGSHDANIINLSAGVYVVTIVDYLGCIRKDTVNILQPDALSLTLTSPEPVPNYNISTYHGNDGSIDLTVSGGVQPYTYAWSNSAVTQDLLNLSANAYSVVVTDSNMCTASGSIVLDQPSTIEMPSGFTPNSDGHNDNFIVHGLEAYPDNVLTIFNRWGNIVYQHENYSNQWNGYNNRGEELPDGTYFAILEIKSQELILKGYVEMKRH